MASKFTVAMRGALLERFAAGLTLADAARDVGISEKTVKSWLTRGRREESGLYAEFARACDDARRGAVERSPEMSVVEFRQQLERSVRRGSVQAMKLWSDLFLRPSAEPEAPADPLAEFDELADRRARSAAAV